jgi:hypothetical protein
MKNYTKLITVLAVSLCSIFPTFAGGAPQAAGGNQGAFGAGLAPKKSTLTNDRAALVTTGESDYNIELQTVLLPLADDPTWSARAVPMAEQIFANGMVTNGNVGPRLETLYIARKTGQSTDGAWLAGKITGKNGKKVRLNMLSFTQDSSDGHSLTNAYSLVGGNWSFAPHAIGVIWGAGGQFAERSTQQKITSGPDQDVDEIDFVIFQGEYYPYSDDAGFNGINAWVVGQNLSVYFACDVVDAAGTIVGRGVVKLQRTGTPMVPQIRISKTSTNGVSLIEFTIEPNWTATLERSTNPTRLAAERDSEQQFQSLPIIERRISFLASSQLSGPSQSQTGRSHALQARDACFFMSINTSY